MTFLLIDSKVVNGKFESWVSFSLHTLSMVVALQELEMKFDVQDFKMDDYILGREAWKPLWCDTVMEYLEKLTRFNDI